MRTRVLGISVCLLFVVVTIAAQEAPQEQSQQQQMMMQRMQQMMEARRQQMMGERTALLEQLRASEERLDELVAVMESSQGTAKTDAIAALVTELVAQRKDLLGLVEAQPGMMQQMQMMQMMQQMMQQMRMGDAAGGPESDQP